MEYYYALLENYKQLKRREFKLSLREEEEGEGMSDEEKAQDLMGKAGKDKDNPANENGVEIYKQDDKVMGRLANDSSPQPQTAVLVKDNELGKSPTAGKLLGMIYGSGEDGEGGDKPGGAEGGEGGDGDAGGEQTVDPAVQRRDAAVKELTTAIDNMSPDDFTPEYQETMRKDRQQKALDLAKAQAAGETEGGEGLSKSVLYEGADLEDKIISSPEIPPERVAESCEAVTASLQAVKKINSGEQLTGEELSELASKVKVTSFGVEFAGVYHQVRARATAANDPFMNNMSVINEQIRKHNETVEEKDRIPEIIPKEPPNVGKLLSKRGPLLERVAVIDSLATALVTAQSAGQDTAALEKELAKELEGARGEETLEELQQMLQKGLCSTAQQCLLSFENTDDVVITQSVASFLTGKNADGSDIPDYDGPGIPEDKAKALVEAASKDGRQALALLVLSTRGFNEAYSDLEVISATQEGGKDANIPGTKTDVRRVVSQESFDRFVADMEANQTEAEKEMAEAAKCAGDGVGAASMKKSVSESEGSGNVNMDVEQKSLDQVKGGRLKSGEQGDGSFRKRCGGEPEKQPEAQEFIDKNTERLNNCTGDMDFGGTPKHKSAVEAACAFQKKLDESPVMRAFNAAKGGQVTDEDGQKVKHTGAALVDMWEGSSAMDPKKRAERAKLAKSGLAKLEAGNEKLTPEERDAVTKIGKDIEKAEISKMLDADTDKGGNVTGESLGYLLTRHSQSAGSMTECIKDVRGYADGGQRLGFMNEATYGAMGMVGQGTAKIKRKPGSFRYDIETTSGTKLAGGGFERGQLVTDVNPETMSNPKAKKEGATREELFMAFLTGQMDLLEKIMHQTRSGPNI